MPAAADDQARRTIDAVLRIESARVIGALARMVGDIGAAEDLAQDALVAALEQWPHAGVPANPGAWLTTTAKRRAIDQLRHRRMAERRHEQLGHELERRPGAVDPDLDAVVDEPIGDDLLSLLFATCHPVLSPSARVALTLRLFGGLSTAEIARAFLARETAVAQRIVRAKRTLAEARVPLEVPASSRPHRWSSSTGRSRCRWPTGRPPRWSWSMPWAPTQRSTATTCCRASAPTSWRASAGSPRPGGSWPGRRS